MQDIEARTTALLAAPAGRAFLRIADVSGLAPEVVARPAVSMHIAACGVDEVSPWRSDHDRVVAALSRRGAPLGAFARAILALSQATWWFGPLDRTQQLWLSRNDSGPAATQLNIPEGPPNSWERYAQKPVGGLYTSTLAEGTSAVLAVLAEGVGDLAAAFHVRPLACWRLEATPIARVFEVDGPEAWHALCVHYPAMGEDHRLVPNWSAVAEDWDAVHLTLGGLLTAEQVRIESAAGWTQLGMWDCEQTVWLRWCFTTAVRLPDVENYPRCPVVLHRPFD